MKVLIAEDDAVSRLTLRRAVEQFGHEVLVATDGTDAWELYRRDEIDVIVSDWLMPGMKGDEFLIEAHKRFPSVVKIMLSGQAETAAVDRARKEAALHDFLAKPWNAAELVESINLGLKDKL